MTECNIGHRNTGQCDVGQQNKIQHEVGECNCQLSAGDDQTTEADDRDDKERNDG